MQTITCSGNCKHKTGWFKTIKIKKWCFEFTEKYFLCLECEDLIPIKKYEEVTCIEIKDCKAWFKEEKEDNLKQEFFKHFSADSFRGYPLEQCHNIWNFFLPHLKSHENEQNN